MLGSESSGEDEEDEEGGRHGEEGKARAREAGRQPGSYTHAASARGVVAEVPVRGAGAEDEDDDEDVGLGGAAVDSLCVRWPALQLSADSAQHAVMVEVST